jgi:hypothetical protein
MPNIKPCVRYRCQMRVAVDASASPPAIMAVPAHTSCLRVARGRTEALCHCGCVTRRLQRPSWPLCESLCEQRVSPEAEASQKEPHDGAVRRDGGRGYAADLARGQRE